MRTTMMIKTALLGGVVAAAAAAFAGTAHATPADTGCDVGPTYVHLATTMVPGLAKTPILGPHSITSEGQLVSAWTEQGYGFDAINNQVARDLHVDTASAGALMGYTGCEIN
jgi:hypothetical protein